VILFISTAFFPRRLLEAPIDTIARYNPLSYLADGIRNPIIATVDAKPVLEGLLAGGAITLLGVAFAVLALRGRLREA
jgi:ABC-2 type transport system permease protein